MRVGGTNPMTTNTVQLNLIPSRYHTGPVPRKYLTCTLLNKYGEILFTTDPVRANAPYVKINLQRECLAYLRGKMDADGRIETKVQFKFNEVWK